MIEFIRTYSGQVTFTITIFTIFALVYLPQSSFVKEKKITKK